MNKKLSKLIILVIGIILLLNISFLGIKKSGIKDEEEEMVAQYTYVVDWSISNIYVEGSVEFNSIENKADTGHFEYIHYIQHATTGWYSSYTLTINWVKKGFSGYVYLPAIPEFGYAYTLNWKVNNVNLEGSVEFKSIENKKSGHFYVFFENYYVWAHGNVNYDLNLVWTNNGAVQEEDFAKLYEYTLYWDVSNSLIKGEKSFNSIENKKDGEFHREFDGRYTKYKLDIHWVNRGFSRLYKFVPSQQSYSYSLNWDINYRYYANDGWKYVKNYSKGQVVFNSIANMNNTFFERRFYEYNPAANDYDSMVFDLELFNLEPSGPNL